MCQGTRASSTSLATPPGPAHYCFRRAACSSAATRWPDVLTGRSGPTLLPDFVNHDTSQALKSLSALESLEVEVVLPHHSEPWRHRVQEAVRLAGQGRPASF